MQIFSASSFVLFKTIKCICINNALKKKKKKNRATGIQSQMPREAIFWVLLWEFNFQSLAV